MPGFAGFFEQLSFLAGAPAGIVILTTAALIVIISHRPALIAALMIQYFFAGLFFAQVLPAQLAGMKIIVGLLVGVIFMITGRQVSRSENLRASQAAALADADEAAESRPEPPQTEGVEAANAGPAGEDRPEGSLLRDWLRRPFGRSLPNYFPFRLMAVVLVVMATWQAANRPEYALPTVTGAMNLAIYFMAALGLLALGLTENPLKIGVALLTLLTAFELFYATVEPALAVLALLAAVDFSVALGTSYLAIVQALPGGTAQAEAAI